MPTVICNNFVIFLVAEDLCYLFHLCDIFNNKDNFILGIYNKLSLKGDYTVRKGDGVSIT